MTAANPSAQHDEAPTLEVKGLSISYRRRSKLLRVVSDLSFEIQPGQAYGLVGESGCGKSTVAMALMRYLPANAVVESGSITFDGQDVLGADPSTLRSWRGNRIAMVYQDPGSALNPSMRIGRQVSEVFATHRGMSNEAALEASAAMLEKVNFADSGRMMQRYAHELSGGQQQRVMIAMALATNPDLLLLDEPTTGLDATVEAEVLDLVEQLRAEYNTSILFISHNLGIVARLCEKVGVLYASRLVEEGRAEEVFEDPRHPYTMSLLRCVPRRGMRKDLRRLDPIPGFLPGLGEKMPGCRFAPRCAMSEDRCVESEPPLIHLDLGSGRSTRCYFPERVPQMPTASSLVNADKPSLSAAPTAAAPAAAVAPAAAHALGADSVVAGSDKVLLSVKDLVKQYHSGGEVVTALAGVTFEIKRGEVFGLVGESGSGKSTLARTIAGLSAPSGGSIAFTSVATSGPDRWIQMVFQNPDTALNPRHTVRRILGRSMKLLAVGLSRSARQARLTTLTSSVRLESRHLDLRPGALSGGLKQRVAIARAFAGSPVMVLCDEPVSALDVSVQAAILNLLVDLQTDLGVSYLFISHDLAVVRYLADRIGVLYLGQLVEVGPAQAVFGPPHHPYTEALLSAIPSVESDGRRERIRLTGTMPSPAHPPSGCRFHTRCPRFLGNICVEQEPPWQDAPGGNTYKCHIAPSTLAALQAPQSDVASA